VNLFAKDLFDKENSFNQFMKLTVKLW